MADLSINHFALGLAGISGESGGFSYGPMDSNKAHELLRYAYDNELRVFDTAGVYGLGESELRLGQAFSSSEREKVHFMTKGGVYWNDQKRIYATNDPKLMEQSVYDSLKRLKTDYIDTYFVHAPDPLVDICFVVDALFKLMNKGIIHNIGLSNTNDEDFRKAKKVAPIKAIQNRWNIFTPLSEIEWIQDEIQLDESLVFYGYGILDSGILAEHNIDRKNWNMLDSSDYRKSLKQWNSPKSIQERDLKYQKIKEMKKLYHINNISTLAFLWSDILFKQEKIHKIPVGILGAKSIKHIDNLLNCFNVSINI